MMPQRTYQTRVGADTALNATLAAYAQLFGRAERTLFARLRAGTSLAALKREFLVRFGLTARQFNALAAELRGRTTSIQRGRVGLTRTLRRRIAHATEILRTIPRGTSAYHQKRRRLAILEQRLAVLQADAAAGRLPLCFGSRTLFRQQFARPANGHRSQQDWLRQWRGARSNQFFVLGSKDETAGCQGCVATVQPDDTITLRLRLPNVLSGEAKHVVIPDLRFRYGHETVIVALGRTLSANTDDHAAISWRFVRDPKGWRVLVTVSVAAAARSTVDGIGAVGIDLNTDHVAVTDLDRFGNPVATFRIPCLTRGKSHHQTLAAIGDAVSQVVTYACLRQKPIVAERLDFAEKKAELEHRGARYARMLSGFAYAAFHTVFSARAYDAGVRVHRVHPAFTSVIGAYKFAARYGLSVHQGAACSIGRRGMQLAERPNRRMGDQVAFPLPVRNRGKHVWSFWRGVARRAAAHPARGRPGPGARSVPAPAPGVTGDTARPVIRSSAAGGIPARESSAALFG